MALTLDTLPFDQRLMLTLLQDHGWQSHNMGQRLMPEYRERFDWLYENLDRPMPEYEPTDLCWQYRWSYAIIRSRMNLVDSVIVAFREPADRTMFVLRWS